MAMLTIATIIAAWWLPFLIAKKMSANAAGLIASILLAYIVAFAGLALVIYSAAAAGYGMRFAESAIAFAMLAALILPPLAVWRGRKATSRQSLS